MTRIRKKTGPREEETVTRSGLGPYQLALYDFYIHPACPMCDEVKQVRFQFNILVISPYRERKGGVCACVCVSLFLVFRFSETGSQLTKKGLKLTM